MHVELVGDGPAAAAVRAALSDVDAEPTTGTPDDVGAADLAVVVDDVGAAAFERASDRAVAAGTPWLGVERGGVGGHRIDGVEAAVAGFAPDAGCFDCLRTRVAANVEEEGDGNDATAGGDRGRPAASSADDPATARFAGAVAGREAARLVSGSESPVLGGVVEVPHARRRFLPVPGCGCDPGSADATLELDHEPASLSDALERAEAALDERVGLVRTVGESESYPAAYYLARNCDTSGFSDATAAPQAAGVSHDWNAAFMKALGEALERYSAGVYRTDDLREAPPSAVENAVPPSAFAGVDAGADDRSLRWVPATNLATGDPAHLPAVAAYFPSPGEPFAPPITTGLGLGSSTVEAVLSGCYEVVERDATMLSWYSTATPLELAVDDEAFRTLAGRARSEGLAVTATLVTQDVEVPVVAAAVHREGGDWPRFAAGSGAALDPAAAARSALAEALQNWMELRAMGPERAGEESGAVAQYAEFPLAAREFLDADGPVPAESVGSGTSLAGRAELDALVSRVADAGLTPYAARLTPRDVGRLGFEAVRVAIPTAQPLFTGEPRFGERARAVPESFGFEPRPDRAFHPYP